MLFDLLARKLPFPSPQGGSETIAECEEAGGDERVSIPSRRVGDPASPLDDRRFAAVSIPSWRVGDPCNPPRRRRGACLSIPSRRVGDQDQELLSRIHDPLSIPSRRVGVAVA